MSAETTEWTIVGGAMDGQPFQGWFFHGVTPGESRLSSVRIKNISAPARTLTLLRVVAFYLHRGTSAQGCGNAFGREVIDEKWMSARIGANPYKPIGGGYGLSDPGANWLDLPDLASGADVVVDFKLDVPSDATTQSGRWYAAAAFAAA